MPDLTIDLTAISAIWMGGSVLLVPLAGLTARFGLKPLLDSVARVRAAGHGSDTAEMEARFEAMERGLRDLARSVERLAEESRRGRAAA